jgi:23S rRNA (adenine2030-N6)-methyltransferase
LNYRHAFHAGNFADVLKHAVLVALLEALARKRAPLCYVDTHAGAGRYDLGGAEAQKTQEHAAGIARLLASPGLPPALHAYLDLVRAINTKAGHADVVEYPGSPLLASLMLRKDDRLLLCEVQDVERSSLELLFAGDARVQVMQRDGYAALKALLPPKERRGLVLVDPPFEQQSDEFGLIADALEPAFKRWATGVYAIWYPIKLRHQINGFHRWLKRCGMPKILVAELLLHPDNTALRLNGCGMAVINAPWKLDTTLESILPVLGEHLAAGRYGSHSLQWLVRE